MEKDSTSSPGRPGSPAQLANDLLSDRLQDGRDTAMEGSLSLPEGSPKEGSQRGVYDELPGTPTETCKS